MLPQQQIPSDPKAHLALSDMPSSEPSDEHYLPVHDKQAALDTVFRDPEVKHGLSPIRFS